MQWRTFVTIKVTHYQNVPMTDSLLAAQRQYAREQAQQPASGPNAPEPVPTPSPATAGRYARAEAAQRVLDAARDWERDDLYAAALAAAVRSYEDICARYPLTDD